MNLLFCNSFLQHHPTPLAGHRQENPEKKHVSEGWHRAILCSKQKPIDIICKWAYYMEKPFTNGKGRGYNTQNQRDRPGACAGSYPENHCGPCSGRSCPDRRKAHAASQCGGIRCRASKSEMGYRYFLHSNSGRGSLPIHDS